MQRLLAAIALIVAASCSEHGADPKVDAAADAPVDGEPVDAAVPDAEEDADEGEADPRPRLSAESFYADPKSKTIAPDLIEFKPAHELWSDGANKRRWIRLPPGARLDTSDMDHWKLPMGGELWKEFSHGDTLLETRLIRRTGVGPNDYFVGAFIWKANQSDAVLIPEGAQNVNGTDHDVPSTTHCWECHSGDTGRMLGVSAIQLAKPGPGTTLDWLAATDRLSHPPPPGADYGAPGDDVTARALGYLHANCGSCHNPLGNAWFQTLVLRLDIADRDPTKTTIHRTTVGVRAKAFEEDGYEYRVVAGKPEASALLFRMNQRGDKKQMPPLASERVHRDGVELVSDWILSLTPP